MKRLNLIIVGILLWLTIPTGVPLAWADVPTVSIQDPQEIRAGQPFSITLIVRHKGNNFVHHISKLVITVDGKEEKVWEYTWKSYPKDEKWSISYELTVKKGATIGAVATCNLHGPSPMATLSFP